MVKTVVLGQGALDKQVGLQRRSTGSAPGEFWSIDRGQFRVGGTATLRIDGTGGLDGDGKFVWRGPADFDGDVKITKTLDVAAQTKLRGALELLADMVVSAGGKITVGAVTIDPANGGKIAVSGTAPVELGVSALGLPGLTFPGLGYVVGYGGGVVLSNLAQSAFMRSTATQAVLVAGTGTKTLGVDATGAFAAGLGTSTIAANLYRNAAGYILQTSSAARFKLATEAMPLPDSLLDIPFEWWFDSGDAERAAELVGHQRPFTAEMQQLDDVTSNLRRIPGVVAEKVAEAGGEAFVTYDGDGQVQGVMYDRLGPALALKVAGKHFELEERVAELERKLEDALSRIAALEG